MTEAKSVQTMHSHLFQASPVSEVVTCIYSETGVICGGLADNPAHRKYSQVPKEDFCPVCGGSLFNHEGLKPCEVALPPKEERCSHCKGTREQCEDNEYCQYRWPSRPPKPSGESVQPQLPPRSKVTPLTAGNWTTDEWNTAEAAVFEMRCKYPPDSLSAIFRDIAINLQAENESLKAQHATDAQIIDRYAKEHLEVIGERDNLLEVVREYRDVHEVDEYACDPTLYGKDTRCPTCIKADALLSQGRSEDE